jgi:sporulation protein YlmC with PRC-barrel domain
MKDRRPRRRSTQEMHAQACIPSLVGAPLADRDGAVVGTVEDLMVAPTTQAPAWLLVRLHGTRAGGPHAFVPAAGMRAGASEIRVPYAAAQIAAAPPGPSADRVVLEHAIRLCRHYAIARALGEASAVHAAAATPPAVAAAA